MLKAIVVLLVCQGLGTVLATWTNLPLPGPVIGMALLLAVLAGLGRVPEPLARLGRGLLGYLGLFFIPPAVGVMVYGDLLASAGLRLLLVMLVSTALAMGVTGLLLQWLLSRLRVAT